MAPEPHLLYPIYAGEIVRDLLLASHLLGISVNALLCEYLEGDAKKMTQMFFFIVFSIFLIMVSCVYILKVDTLTIPKW